MSEIGGLHLFRKRASCVGLRVEAGSARVGCVVGLGRFPAVLASPDRVARELRQVMFHVKHSSQPTVMWLRPTTS